MHVIGSILALTTLFTLASATNILWFYNTFPELRIVCWFPNAGSAGQEGTYVYPGANPIPVYLDDGWSGM